MEKYNSLQYYTVPVVLPDPLRRALDTELAQYNLSPMSVCISFKRHGFTSEQHPLQSSIGVHVDWNWKQQAEPYHAAIIFPVSGCKDTYQYWMQGNYTLINQEKSDAKDGTVEYSQPSWNEPGVVADEKAYIEHEPMLVRTDIPHSVISRADGSYRTILSVRVTINEKFNDIVEKIKAKTN